MSHEQKNISFSNIGSRNEVRKRVIIEFLKEKPGTGKGKDATHYTYYVETLADGKRIYLTRPGFINKQFDFVINVEAVNFNKKRGRERTNPSHNDIFTDLEGKKRKNPRNYKKLFLLIQKVYDCQEIKPSGYKDIEFNYGYSIDLILYVIKWYFIEQDIAYWNYSGRQMFMSSVPKPR